MRSSWPNCTLRYGTPESSARMVEFQHSDFLLHVQANLKKFMDYIQTSAVDKMVKFMDKGLDPNFQDSDTGGEENNCPSL